MLQETGKISFVLIFFFKFTASTILADQSYADVI